MNWKAIGIDTGTIYATGTHADCSRAVNETKRGELVKIMRADQAFEPMDDNAEIDRLAKEWQLMELQEKQRLEDEKTKKTRVHNFDQQKWTSEEEAYVKTNINMPNKELLAGLKSHFGKTVTLKALNARKYKLRQLYNLPAMQTNRWKPEEDAYIIKNYHRLTAAKIGEAIGRTTAAVSERVQVLRRTGKFDSSKRCEPEQSNRVVPGPETSVAVRESGEHPNDRMGEDEMTEKMDTTQIIKPDDSPDDTYVERDYRPDVRFPAFQEDNVNHPQHYKHGEIETLDIIRMSLTDEEFQGFLKGNVLKYQLRAPFKHATPAEDYKKAKYYYDEYREVSE